MNLQFDYELENIFGIEEDVYHITANGYKIGKFTYEEFGENKGWMYEPHNDSKFYSTLGIKELNIIVDTIQRLNRGEVI